MSDNSNYRLFSLGNVLVTQGALRIISETERDLFLRRHQCGDWHETQRESRAENTIAMLFGGRILTHHKTQAGIVIWIITEGDQSATTMLLA